MKTNNFKFIRCVLGCYGNFELNKYFFKLINLTSGSSSGTFPIHVSDRMGQSLLALTVLSKCKCMFLSSSFYDTLFTPTWSYLWPNIIRKCCIKVFRYCSYRIRVLLSITAERRLLLRVRFHIDFHVFRILDP